MRTGTPNNFSNTKQDPGVRANTPDYHRPYTEAVGVKSSIRDKERVPIA